LEIDPTKQGYKTRKNFMQTATAVMFTQMQAKVGIQQFGEEAIAALVKEFKQLDEGAIPGKRVVCPVDPGTLTKQEKIRALNTVTLIKQKRDGSIKGRACADGRKQRKFLSDDVKLSSPTVSLEGLFATLLVDAYEDQHISTFNVTGAFLQPELPDK
jgi:hypothetical protein